MQTFPLKPSTPPNPSGRERWIMLAGKLGFLFFLVKGLCWLIVPPLLVWLGVNL